MMTTNKPTPANRHKRMLAEKGWTYRTAAAALDVHWTHLNRVLQGERVSKSLLDRIEKMPRKGAAK
jgi:plasmid maintenance system antidote protein VapI